MLDSTSAFDDADQSLGLKCFLSYLSKQFFSLAGFYKVSDWVFIFHTKSLKPKGESTLANSGPESLEASAWAWDP